MTQRSSKHAKPRISAVGISGPAMEPSAQAAPENDYQPIPQAHPEAKVRFSSDSRRRRVLALADVVSATAISLVAVGDPDLVVWPLAFMPAWIVLAKVFGLYDRDHRCVRHLTIDELPSLLAWAGIVAAGLALLLPLTPLGEVSVPTMFLSWLVGATTAFVLRGGARVLWRRLTPVEVTAVIGSGELSAAVRRKLELFPDIHLTLGENPFDESISAAQGEPAPVLSARADRVIVATEELRPAWIEELAVACRARQVKLTVVSPLRGPAAAAVRLSKLADLSLLEYNTWDISRSTLLIKRGFDLTAAALALAVVAPLLPLIALAIKLDSRGPLFFVQRRAGLNGHPFQMLKFRTMVADADQALRDLVVLDELPEPVFKLADDPRVTRVGRMLRRFSIDELPQLINVLRGQMSIVGPRPEQIELVERYRPEHRFRLAISPGMTGPMQISGRGALSFAERLAVELDYVENLSFTRDLRILAQTLPTITRGTGAY